jgi:hypothetical protein
MARYVVTCHETVTVDYSVEADSPEEAIAKIQHGDWLDDETLDTHSITVLGMTADGDEVDLVAIGAVG